MSTYALKDECVSYFYQLKSNKSQLGWFGLDKLGRKSFQIQNYTKSMLFVEKITTLE